MKRKDSNYVLSAMHNIDGDGTDGESSVLQPVQASFHPLGAGFIGAFVAVILTLSIVFMIYKRKQQKKKNGYAEQLVKRGPGESRHAESTKVSSSYFDMECSSSILSKLENPDVSDQSTKYKKANVYSPTKQKNIDEKENLLAIEKKNEDSTLERTSEKENLTLRLHSSPKQNDSSTSLFNNRCDQESEPPKLPPKLGSLKKGSNSNTSLNENKNNSTCSFANPNNLNNLELPQSKYPRDCNGSETGSLFLNPFQVKPFCAKKTKIEKHETFSEPRSRLNKPPVLPKSDALARSSSMRIPTTHPPASEQHSTPDDQQLSRLPGESLRSSGRLFPTPKNDKTLDSRNTDISSSSRNPVKGGVAVLPPIATTKKM